MVETIRRVIILIGLIIDFDLKLEAAKILSVAFLEFFVSTASTITRDIKYIIVPVA